MSKADESRLSASLSPTASPTARATRRHLLLGGSALAAAAAALSVAKPVLAQTLPSGSEILPVPDQPFRGVIGRKASESKPDFPKAVTAPGGAPNVLLIMTDDVGFGAASAFGGPIPTPTLERVAANGLRYNQFHTTALCSPTRAALLTGRNHQTSAWATSRSSPRVIRATPRSSPRAPARSATFSSITATTRHGSASTTSFRSGCKVRAGRSTSGPGD